MYKTVGPNNVLTLILKSLAAAFTEPFEVIFIKCLNTGRLPRDWKEAIITPIYKK